MINKTNTDEPKKCLGWEKDIIAMPIYQANKSKCGKTITAKNSTEESRGINMCYKCFNAMCKYNERCSC